MIVRSFAPGRVNLMGDHTDYSGGLVLPMAIDLGTTVEFQPERGSRTVDLVSADDASPARVPLERPLEGVVAGWARYVAGVVGLVRPDHGGRGRVTTSLPLGAGLSSSAALEVSVALAVGDRTLAGSPLALAQLCQRAEQAASGVPCGIMDQLTSVAGQAGHALLIDCTSLSIGPVPVTDAAEVVVVHSEEPRTLAGSAYAERRAQVERAADVLGMPLRTALPDDAGRLADPLLRRRARHVITENRRVEAAASALRAGDLPAVGALMDESHRSLADDFEVSTPALDALVDRLRRSPGVFGARLTGAGFGGCAVAVVAIGSGPALAASFRRAWVVRASAGATVTAA